MFHNLPENNPTRWLGPYLVISAMLMTLSEWFTRSETYIRREHMLSRKRMDSIDELQTLGLKHALSLGPDITRDIANLSKKMLDIERQAGEVCDDHTKSAQLLNESFAKIVGDGR